MLRMLLRKAIKKFRRATNDELAEHRAEFIVKFGDVLKACQEMRCVIEPEPRQLARRYMSSVIKKRTDAAWWNENIACLTEPWFIYEYACDEGIIARSQPSGKQTMVLFTIEPEEKNHDGYVRIYIERKVGNPECGRIILEYACADDPFQEHVRSQKFEYTENQCARTIDGTGGGILNRAVETALVLLRHGYCICASEMLMKERILAEEYEPEHPYWVVEGSELDKLELRYPKDRQLHGYVYRAGGRWNGKTVEISICNAHLLDDLIRLYGFRITDGAKVRMDTWKETVENATIYRPRRKKDMQSEPPMVDRFRELMDRKPQIIDDLYENDE